MPLLFSATPNTRPTAARHRMRLLAAALATSGGLLALTTNAQAQNAQTPRGGETPPQTQSQPQSQSQTQPQAPASKPPVTKNLGAAFRESPAAPVPGDIQNATLPTVFQHDAPETPEELRQLETHVQGLIDRLLPATVCIQTNNATGSGVIVTGSGHILTAGHVFDRPGRRVRIVFPDGSTAEGESLGHNEGIDSGMCKIVDPAPEGGWPHVPVGDLNDNHTGDYVLAIGHPGGYDPDRPYVVRLGRLIQAKPDVLQTDATVVGGDSGGPLFDMHGRVIGIHSRIQASLNSNFHIPITTYLETWDRLLTQEIWGQTFADRLADRMAPRPKVGIQGKDNPKGTGAMIDEVTPDTPASDAGIRPGDVILRFNNVPIEGFNDLRQQVVQARPGDKVTLTIQRGERTLQLPLIIGP